MAEIASGSIDLKSLKVAGMNATDYITDITNNGIFVHSKDSDALANGSGVHIGANEINIIKEGVSNIKAWVTDTIPYIRIGREDSGNVLIDNDSVDIRDGTTVSASFGANNVTLGNPTNTPHVIMTPRIMTYYDADGDPSAILHYDADPSGNTKAFIISSESDSQDTASLRLQSADYASTGTRSNIELVAQNAPDEDGEDPATVALLLNGRGVTLTYSGDTTLGSGLFRVISRDDDANSYDKFKIDAFGFCTAATDGLLFSGSDALALFDVTTGTIASLAMYRYGKVIQLNVAFKNTSSVESNSNVLEATWAPGWPDDIKPVNSVNGSSFYRKTPLPGSFTASNGRLIVHNASTAAVTVSSNTLITFTYIAKNAL